MRMDATEGGRVEAVVRGEAGAGGVTASWAGGERGVLAFFSFPGSGGC